MNHLPFNRLPKRLLRGFGGGGQRMIFNVSLDHKCHVNKMTDRAGLARRAKSGVGAATQLPIALIRYFGSELLDQRVSTGYEW